MTVISTAIEPLHEPCSQTVKRSRSATECQMEEFVLDQFCNFWEVYRVYDLSCYLSIKDMLKCEYLYL